MRTTLTLRDSIAGRLRRIAERQNRPFKDVVNEALAAGLERLEVAEPPLDYTVRAREFGLRKGIDSDKLNQLYDELETHR